MYTVKNYCYHCYWITAILRQYYSIIIENSWQFHYITRYELFMKFHGKNVGFTWQRSSMKVPLTILFHGISMA